MTHSLGRLVDLHERSRLYQAPQAAAHRSVLWGHHAPVLDQLDTSSCTGHATANLINCDVFSACRPGGYLTHEDAMKI